MTSPAPIQAQTALQEAIDETDLSTQPACAQASARFPGPDGDARRTQGYRRTQSPRPQAAVSLTRQRARPTGAANLNRLRTRSDYKAVSRGTRVVRPGFILLAARREETDLPARFGFTVSRRVGNAVTRNRVRRRLKELVRTSSAAPAAGTDYVLIGRSAAAGRRFSAMADDLATAMARIAANGAA